MRNASANHALAFHLSPPAMTLFSYVLDIVWITATMVCFYTSFLKVLYFMAYLHVEYNAIA